MVSINQSGNMGPTLNHNPAAKNAILQNHFKYPPALIPLR